MTVAIRMRDALAALSRPVVIALSGGADSAATAWAAVDAGITARCVHIDHRLEGSPTMRSAAAEVAARLGLELDVVEVSPASASEADLRSVRYEALLGSLAAGEVLVTAHTADDQAETVLLNLFRGTGLPGLGGIPSRRGPIRRPILALGRDEVRALADRMDLPYVDDPENESGEHLRNRVRTDLIPWLETEFNPALRTNLVRMAGGVSDALEPMLAAAARVPREVRGSSIRVAIGPLMAAEPPVRRWVLREMLGHVRGPYPPSREEVARAEAVLLAGGGADFADSRHRFQVVGPWYELSPPRVAPPGPTELADGSRWGAFRFRTAPWKGDPLLSKWRFVHPSGAYTVRTVAADDRIGITTGHKDAREAIREAGIGADAWPVVTDASGTVVWIPGVRHAAWPPAGSSGYFETIAEEDAGWAPFQP